MVATLFIKMFIYLCVSVYAIKMKQAKSIDVPVPTLHSLGLPILSTIKSSEIRRTCLTHKQARITD